ncbi:LysR family transcriptional regulator [uncultured Ruminococcus sp.]|uniref:LysR family transcriptional regulator n=1 Tax=uncultured Ruminococcus sp. TaxID=165186 RepID=UPI002634F610|nr:LysR family transcriptional regulator [uncultured Ruminococcus sp.]
MTLQQLQYIIAIAEHGSISETAKQLYIAQPTLSSAVRTLEEEFGITIFHRSPRGITLTEDGREFLSYARQVVEQADLLHQHYGAVRKTSQRCAISTQHYAFAVDAFVRLVQRLSPEAYEFTLRETRTHEIMEDVRNFDSEIGILYLSSFNEKVIRAMLEEYGLEFHSLVTAEPHVFLRASHPLAGQAAVTTADLEPYPFLCFEQGVHNSFYFAEELLSTMPHRKCIRVSDRATLFNLLRGVQGYTICSGMVSAELNGGDIVSVPLDTAERMEIGWISNPKTQSSRAAQMYIQELRQVLEEYQGTKI